MNRQAQFSEDGKHRFWLLRSWEQNPKMLLIIGLNPSTADDEKDDPTIRSCIRLATNNGFGGFVMCNLYSFITSDPEILKENMQDAVRPETDETLKRMIRNTQRTVCAWGKWSFIDERVKEVLQLIKEPHCFRQNNNGSPAHPLYLPNHCLMQTYKP
jgi:hypothetical protein